MRARVRARGGAGARARVVAVGANGRPSGKALRPELYALDASWDPMTSGDRRESEESVMPLPESLPEITSGGSASETWWSRRCRSHETCIK